MTGRLEGKVALITGAGSGMGRAAAELFAGEGARIVVSDVDEDAGAEAVAAVRAAGGDATFVRANVAEWDDCQAMVAAAMLTYGALHVLYNNAGIFPADDGGVLDTPQATWRKVMAVNLEGVWLGCKAGIPAMLESGGGAIVNVASFVALMGAATAQIAYTSSKGGVLAMTREIAVEYARQGIRVNALCPGPIQTPLLEELLSDPDRRARRMVHIPMGRLGRAEELAKAALFLASDDASFMTGAALVVDGGITAAYVTPEQLSPTMPPMTTVPGMLTAEELKEAIVNGAIDTVLVAFPDLQGRLVGKRVTGHYWNEQMKEGTEPVHACNYLLAVDVDMNPLSGYQFANWEQGYGDVAVMPDLATIRRIPWLDATALVICDVVDENAGEPVEVSPRRILQRQIARAADLGFTVLFASELEFFLFRESIDEAAAKGYANLTPHSQVIEDYHILQTTRDEYVIRAIRNAMDGAGVPIEFSKGEAGRGQHEINLAYSTAVEMADRHVVYKNGAKEIASQLGLSITFMAKYSDEEVGSSCHIHSSLWDPTGEKPLMWEADGPDHQSAAFRGWLGGQLACGRELAWMFAPTVNSYKRYQPESWAPTALAWSVDNRTCGFRVVGHGASFRLESRIPGGDVNPYLAYAATIAAGLHGIEHGIAPSPRFDGNAYAAEELARVPSSLAEATDAFATSKVAADAFGTDVHDHLLNTARQELAHFNRAVTDWERRRNFDQW